LPAAATLPKLAAMTDYAALLQSHFVHPGKWDASFAPLTLSELFDARVARTPQARLTDFMGARLSYADIAARARRFAAALQERGVGRVTASGCICPTSPITRSRITGRSWRARSSSTCRRSMRSTNSRIRSAMRVRR